MNADERRYAGVPDDIRVHPRSSAAPPGLRFGDRGQAMLEFLLAVPLLLLIVFLIASFGRGWLLKQRAVVGSRYAAWHIAQGGRVSSAQDPNRFQRDFFYGDPTAGLGGAGPANDGKLDFQARLNPNAGLMDDYWQRIRQDSSGVIAERAAVDYVPPGQVYRYALTRIGETSSRERRSWHLNDVNCWRFFGERIMQEASTRESDVYAAFDQAGQQGLATLPPGDAGDPVLLQALNADLAAHRSRMTSHYTGWINSWRRG
jgi:hypothetical protein